MSRDISDFVTVEIIDIFDQAGNGKWRLNHCPAEKCL